MPIINGVYVPKGWDLTEENNFETPVDEPKTVVQKTEAAAETLPKTETKPRVSSRKGWAIDEDFDEVSNAATLTPPVAKSAASKRRAYAVEDYDDEPQPQEKRNRAADKAIIGILAENAVPSPAESLEPQEATQVAEPALEPFPAPSAPKLKPIPVVPVTRLSERAMLVSLNISQWSGRRHDRAVTDEVNSRKAASANAGRYNKVLLPDCEPLAEVHRQTSSLRNWFVAQTLPWLNDGARIIPSANYLKFNQEFRARKSTWLAAVQQLVTEYPALKVKAKSQLQSMHNPEDYPMAHELADKFDMAIRIMPMPDHADFRIDLSADVMAAIREQMVDHEQVIASTVTADCVARLHKVVGAMAERLSDPDAIFRNSLVDNLCEVVSTLGDMNITGDAELEKLRQLAEDKLTGFSADELRDDMSKRKTAAHRAKAITDQIAAKMSTLMGPAQ